MTDDYLKDVPETTPETSDTTTQTTQETGEATQVTETQTPLNASAALPAIQPADAKIEEVKEAIAKGEIEAPASDGVIRNEDGSPVVDDNGNEVKTVAVVEGSAQYVGDNINADGSENAAAGVLHGILDPNTGNPESDRILKTLEENPEAFSE